MSDILQLNYCSFHPEEAGSSSAPGVVECDALNPVPDTWTVLESCPVQVRQQVRSFELDVIRCKSAGVREQYCLGLVHACYLFPFKLARPGVRGHWCSLESKRTTMLWQILQEDFCVAWRLSFNCINLFFFFFFKAVRRWVLLFRRCLLLCERGRTSGRGRGTD